MPNFQKIPGFAGIENERALEARKGRFGSAHDGTALALVEEGMNENGDTKCKSILRTALVMLSWGLLLIGFVLSVRAAVMMMKTSHLTTDTLSWSTSAFLALLIGSLLNSVAKREKV